MTPLEARRLSAEFCGHEPRIADSDVFILTPHRLGGRDWTCWTPDTNAEQMAECMDKILEGGDVWFYSHTSPKAHVRFDLSEDSTVPVEMMINCPWRHFPMYAAAELQRRKG